VTYDRLHILTSVVYNLLCYPYSDMSIWHCL